MEAVLIRSSSGVFPAIEAASPNRRPSSLSIHDRHGSVGDFGSPTRFCNQLRLSDRRRTGSGCIRRAMSESDMRFDMSWSLPKGAGSRSARIEEEWWQGAAVVVEREGLGVGIWDDVDMQEEVGFPGGGIGKGKEFGGGSRGGDDEGFGGDGGDGASKLDEYYKQMLKLNPTDPLLLINYARFLHEVEKDTPRADEYYGRAILANPGDGEVLGLYAKFIWETQRDLERASCYFDQAVIASPENCMVMGMYAEFMWVAEEDEEEENEADMSMNVASPISSTASISAAISAY